MAIGLQERITLAELGDSRAQTLLGEIYLMGENVERNIDVAKKWLSKAAEQGCAEAQYHLGRIYEPDPNIRNLKITARPLLSEFWYQKSADQGYAPAQYRLGTAYAVIAEKYHLYGQGISSSSGGLYDAARGVVVTNVEKAEKLLISAAEQGHKDAIFNLDTMFTLGLSETSFQNRSLDDIMLAFKEGALSGDPYAQYNHGLAYIRGYFSTEDSIATGFSWMEKSAAQGCAPAIEYLSKHAVLRHNIERMK